MVSFGSLPGEIILSIIALVTPLSIRRCRQVSRFLKNLVDEDHYIQYLLELDAHGYVQPSHPRRDLNYAGKLEILRDHVMMWNQLGNNPPHFYKIPFGEQVTMHAFSKGVFAWGVRYGESYAAHQIHLYRFASRNRGTSFSNQVFSYPTIKVAAFFMDVDQDLLVLIEESPGQTFQTHSRLLSTNEPHPKAALCESVITHTYTLPNVSDRDDLMIEIANHSLAVLLPGPHYDPGLRVDVWDWTTGQQLSCLNISGTQGLSGCLLSEDLLAICKPSIPFDPDTHPCIGKSGSLDVYRFSLHPVVPLAPVIAASFKLPCQKSSRTEYIIAAQNGITHPGSHIPNNGFAQAYSLASHNRILRILVCSSNAITQTCLFSMSTIFDMLPKCQIEDYPTDHLVIPWADWAQYTYWPIGTDPEFIPHFGRSTGLSGQRAAGIQSGRDDCLITVLDIDQCRMRSRSMPGVEPFGDVCVSESNVMHRDWRDDGEPPGSNDWMPIKSYAQKTFSIELDWRTLKEVMIDDEYVVVMAIHTHDSFKRELHVYSL